MSLRSPANERRRPPVLPAWDPAANPVKLRCAAKRVYGFGYADGTVELICRERGCKRPGFETRHLFNPINGAIVDLHIPKPEM